MPNLESQNVGLHFFFFGRFFCILWFFLRMMVRKRRRPENLQNFRFSGKWWKWVYKYTAVSFAVENDEKNVTYALVKMKTWWKKDHLCMKMMKKRSLMHWYEKMIKKTSLLQGYILCAASIYEHVALLWCLFE